jgi:hemolysin activation/secretion protein
MPRLRDYSLRSGFRAFSLGLLLQALAQVASAADCTALSRVDIVAAELPGESGLAMLTRPFLGRCIDSDVIRTILSKISNDLIARGYVTSRPYLLEQDISDGQIEIQILVGTIEAIIDADSGATNGQIATAFMFNDEILNLRQLETSLEAIERVRSVSANFEIRPGTKQGGSIVAIKTVETNPFHTELGVNARTDLDPQLSFQAVLDNPLDINDIVEFRYNSGEVFQALQSNRSRELNYSFPLGSYLLALNHSDIEYEQRVQGINDSFLSAGDTVSDQLRISKLVSRSQTARLTFALAVEVKDSRSFFDDQLIDVSSYKTSQLRLELRHDWLQPWGQINTSFSYHQGLDSFGARDDDYYTLEGGFESEAKLQFEKFNIDSQLFYYLQNPAWYASVKLYLQYSDDILFDNDKLYLGSPYTVRGYSSALSGSNAWYLRSDITRRLQAVVNPFSGNPLTKSISLSAGVDYGDVKCEIDNPDICGEIYSIGMGVEISDANFIGRLLWGHPLKEIGDDIGDQDIFSLDLRWAL